MVYRGVSSQLGLCVLLPARHIADTSRRLSKTSPTLRDRGLCVSVLRCIVAGNADLLCPSATGQMDTIAPCHHCHPFSMLLWPFTEPARPIGDPVWYVSELLSFAQSSVCFAGLLLDE